MRCSLIFVIFTSKEFTNSEVDSTPFLEEGSVGDRAKAEYVSFAAKYHQGNGFRRSGLFFF